MYCLKIFCNCTERSVICLTCFRFRRRFPGKTAAQSHQVQPPSSSGRRILFSNRKWMILTYATWCFLDSDVSANANFLKKSEKYDHCGKGSGMYSYMSLKNVLNLPCHRIKFHRQGTMLNQRDILSIEKYISGYGSYGGASNQMGMYGHTKAESQYGFHHAVPGKLP